jgi:hypothetical protein
MKKRQLKRLNLISETLRRLEQGQAQYAKGGQDYQCGPTEDSSGGFSGMPISYCDTISGNSACP